MARASSDMPVLSMPLGELPADPVHGLALPGSEFEGVGWRSADRLALLVDPRLDAAVDAATEAASLCELLGGDTLSARFGGVFVAVEA